MKDRSHRYGSFSNPKISETGDHRETLRKLMESFLQVCRSQFEGDGFKDDRLSGLLGELFGNVGNVTSLKCICSDLGMQGKKIYEPFKKNLGCTPWRFMQMLRIITAMYLMCSSSETQRELPCCDISTAVGFNRYQSFRRAFRKLTGLSPREFLGSEDQLESLKVVVRDLHCLFSDGSEKDRTINLAELARTEKEKNPSKSHKAQGMLCR